MWCWIALIAGLLLVGKLYYWLISGKCHSTKRLDGKTAIVTGASAGIGKETARDLASRGARVILACRNVTKAQNIADDIIYSTGNRNVVVRQVDTSDLTSVRKFAKGILDTESALHILVNNAGFGGLTTRQLTDDGLEKTMATNHFGHFLMTNMLLDLLKSSGPSRIVNVSSVLHSLCTDFDPEDLNFEKRPYPGTLLSYAHSKLCNILFTVELSNRLRDTGVTTNAIHPGLVSTEIFDKDGNWLLNMMVKPIVIFFGKDPKQGAQTTIFAAVSEEVENLSGEYFVDCKIEATTLMAKDQLQAKKLWEASERLVKLTPEDLQYKGKKDK